MRFLRFLLLFLGFVSLFSVPAVAHRNDSPENEYRQAFAHLDAGEYDAAFRIIGRGSDPVLNMVLRGYAMARPGNDYSFDEISSFIADHPSWPNMNDLLMIAEQKLPSSASAEQTVNWFNAHQPLTPPGFYRYIDALQALGQTQTATETVRQRWIDRNFSNDELQAYYTRFASLLRPQDHRARLDRLLWVDNITAARQMYPLVGVGEKALAEARLALANQTSGAESLIAHVPESLQRDSGLLYERVRWRSKNNMDDAADDILLHAPERMERPDIWWSERNLLARRAMEKNDFALAYRLVARHGMASGSKEYAQAEFLAGWLALRFLDKPAIAEKHFQALLNAATTPISRARGAYWLGRAYEAMDNKTEAEQAYETAAALNTTFYGQLATTRLYANPVITAMPEPAIPSSIRSQFFANENILAIQHLARINQMDRVRSFFKAAADNASQRVEFVLLMELAYQLQRPDWAITTAKAASQKNMIVAAASYPVLSMRMPSPPEPAFTHALIRQESLFNTDAGSPVGARGLMQLMPKTAEGVARKLGIPFKPARLTDPDFNVRLGTAFIQQQIDSFDGSLILALAGYNAGPRRAREWMTAFGDPRTSRVDPIDWIELIPIQETRNYIQRIVENLQFYRARLNGGRAPLQIVQDLKR
jgi:soluble lytic murein transglycosylase